MGYNSTDVICAVGLVAFSIGEHHTHIESSGIADLRHFAGVDQNITDLNHEVASLKRSLLRAVAAPVDEFESRTTLNSFLSQTGLTPLDLPELTALINPRAALDLQSTLQKRTELMSAFPSIAPAEGWISSAFGDRKDPMSQARAEHKGLDISNVDGTPIVAPSDGIVRYAGKYGGFGHYVAIVHGYGIVTKYAHLKEVRVKAGQPIKRGEIVALMGSSGKSTGTHLHYEIWVGDKPFNPYAFMPKALDPNSALASKAKGKPDNLPARNKIELAASH